MSIQTRAAALALTATAVIAAGPVRAQEYPSRSIRIILPFSPGGVSDLLARLLAQRFQASMGQPATVDNRAGAGGNIGAELTAKSPPDGYTLMLSTASLTVNVTLYPKLPLRIAGSEYIAGPLNFGRKLQKRQQPRTKGPAP